MGDVLAFARLAHAVALDGLGQDHGRLALVVHRGVIGGIDLVRVVAAAVELPDFLVAHVRDQRLQLLVLAEEVLPGIGAALGLERLVLAVDRLVHPPAQQAGLVALEQGVPERAPDHLDHVPAGAPEVGLELLDDLAVAAHRPVEPLQVAVDHEDQVVELLARRQRDRAQALRLVHLAVAAEHPDLAALGLHDAAIVQILHEAGLVDAHERPEAHRDGRELPEVRHQPGVRVGGQALAAGLLAEVVELAAPRSGPRDRPARRSRARSGPGCRPGRRRGPPTARARSG